MLFSTAVSEAKTARQSSTYPEYVLEVPLRFLNIASYWPANEAKQEVFPIPGSVYRGLTLKELPIFDNTAVWLRSRSPTWTRRIACLVNSTVRRWNDEAVGLAHRTSSATSGYTYPSCHARESPCCALATKSCWGSSGLARFLHAARLSRWPWHMQRSWNYFSNTRPWYRLLLILYSITFLIMIVEYARTRTTRRVGNLSEQTFFIVPEDIFALKDEQWFVAPGL